ncbi:MAG: ACT domain-containing protein [Calditrichaeota bacterium]|nr:MAG: ACT domain-containing protein [Calditrichota bacterium]
MQLKIQPNKYSICRLAPNAAVPVWAIRGTFHSITRTEDELSIVCEQKDIPPDVQAERDWRLFTIAQKLDFSLIGILASIADPLVAAGISIFVVSTFDTDHFLVKLSDFDSARKVLLESQFTFVE